MAEERTIIVLALHRTGSSLVAGMLDRLGVDMGATGDVTAPDNPKGYYEDWDLVTINDRILELAGGNWYSPPPLEAIDQAGRRPEIRTALADWLAFRRKNGPWGFKDPRVCLTLPLFFNRLPNPLLICTHRNHLAMAGSLETRNQIPIELGLGLGLQYDLRRLGLLKAWPEVPRLHLSYEALIEDGPAGLNRLAEFVGLPPTKDALAFIDPTLRRHR